MTDVLVPEDFLATLNRGLRGALEVLRRMEAQTGKLYRLELRLNTEGEVEAHVVPESERQS